MKRLILLCSLLVPSLLAAPTDMREWHSTAGTTINASALELANGEVMLKAEDGREFKVALDKFVEADRAFLLGHFKEDEAEGDAGVPAVPDPPVLPEPPKPAVTTVEISGDAMVTEGLAHPVGEVSGPVDAGGGSHYFVYIPRTLREGRLAPLMFITGSGGGDARLAQAYAKGAEVNGWILAASVESRNGEGHPVENHEHAKRCVEHLLNALPIDGDRVYFSGNSGGGAMSFYNAQRIKSMGNMPIIGYSPDREYSKKQYCFGIGGTTDYNRYLTANAVAEFGNRGTHRFSNGGHADGPAWLGDEGITWLNGRYLGDRRKDSGLTGERLDFEASVIGWIKELSAGEPYRAYYWCNFLNEDYRITGNNAEVVAGLVEQLRKEPTNVEYAAGIYELDEFSEKYYAVEGEGGGSKFNHTTARIQKASEKLAESFSGVPLIEDLALSLGKATVGE